MQTQFVTDVLPHIRANCFSNGNNEEAAPPFLPVPSKYKTHANTHSLLLIKSSSSPPAVRIADTQAVASIQNAPCSFY